MDRLPFAVIAAAGRGTRFEDSRPKLLAPVGGEPCVRRVVRAVEEGLGEHRQVIVVGYAAEEIVQAIGEAPHRVFIYQPHLQGTGDALRQALKAIHPKATDAVYFFCGDKPLIRPETIRRFHQAFQQAEARMMFLVGRVEGSEEALRRHRQGRVVQVHLDGQGPEVLGIVEYPVILALGPKGVKCFQDLRGQTWAFSQEELWSIREVNVSTYAWRGPELWEYVGELRNDNPKREFFVTDLVEIYRWHGHWVSTMALEDPKEGWGIDTVEEWLRAKGAVEGGEG